MIPALMEAILMITNTCTGYNQPIRNRYFETVDQLQSRTQEDKKLEIELFYLNTIEHLFLFVEQLDQLEVCLPYSRLLAGITNIGGIPKFKVEFK